MAAVISDGMGAKRSGQVEHAGNPQAGLPPKAAKDRAETSTAMPPTPTSTTLAMRGDAKGGAPARRLGNNVTPAAAVPHWELGWSEDDQKYYFLDRQNGLSSWDRPPGCDIELPAKPPADQPRKVPPTAQQVALPPGWEMAFDPVHKKHYYYNHSTRERSWKHPGMDALAARPTSTG